MTTPPNAPEVDVLAVFDDCISKLEYHYRDTRAGAEMTQARTDVADLLTREAALVAEVAGLREDIADRNRTIACKNIDIRERDASLHGWAEQAKKAEAERDALAAEVGALRLDAERGRWIVSQMEIGSVRTDLPLYRAPYMIVYEECGSIDGIKAAIDAARAEAGHGSPPVG